MEQLPTLPDGALKEPGGVVPGFQFYFENHGNEASNFLSKFGVCYNIVNLSYSKI